LFGDNVVKIASARNDRLAGPLDEMRSALDDIPADKAMEIAKRVAAAGPERPTLEVAKFGSFI
jgi:hypothetical protein